MSNFPISTGTGPNAVSVDLLPDGSGAQQMKLLDGNSGSTNALTINTSGEAAVRTNDTVVQGSISAVGSAVTITLNGNNTVVVALQGTTNPSSYFIGEITYDGTTWVTAYGWNATGTSGTWSSTQAGVAYTAFPLRYDAVGAKQFRFRCTSYTATSTFILRAVGGNTTPYHFAQAVSGDINSGAFDAGSYPPVKTGGTSVKTTAGWTSVPNDTYRTTSAYDYVGRQLSVQAPRTLVKSASVLLSSTTETTFIAAAGAGFFNDITQLDFQNNSSTGVTVALRDTTAGAVINTWWLPPNGGISLSFPVAKAQTTANTIWTLQLGATGSTVYANATYVVLK